MLRHVRQEAKEGALRGKSSRRFLLSASLSTGWPKATDRLLIPLVGHTSSQKDLAQLEKDIKMLSRPVVMVEMR